jgi:DNA mismatch endonuclease (patch repair protein)
MRANKSKNTGPEVMLRRLLRKRGLTGYKTNWEKAPGRPDVAFPSAKVAVFLNGCFWHRCPYCRLTLPKKNRVFWKKKFSLNKTRDSRKSRELRALGWKPIVVWECFIAKRPKRLKNALSDIHRATGESLLVDR